MREIQISTEVFAKIWALRVEGEEDENSILKRILGIPNIGQPTRDFGARERSEHASGAKVLWRDDVRTALEMLGGTAHLRQIYDAVRNTRRKTGRSVPINLEAVVRRELEYNSSDTRAFTGHRDWFQSDKIGDGVWSLRENNRP